MSDRYRLEIHPYRHELRQPILTRYGEWRYREGAIVVIKDSDDHCGYGEIAPIPWFGSEDFAAAMDFCRSLGNGIDRRDIWQIPDIFPACQFAFSSADHDLNCGGKANDLPIASYTGLLPAGKKAIETWNLYWQKGIRTFKWKVGVGDIDKEIELLLVLRKDLPNNCKLRLDANGSWSYSEAVRWFDVCENLPGIEFIEQPLPVDSLAQMFALSQRYSLAISLDESITTYRQIVSVCDAGWRGIYTIKPSIAGYSDQWLTLVRQNRLDVVLSSAIETKIGRNSVFRLLSELDNSKAVGFSPDPWFIE